MGLEKLGRINESAMLGDLKKMNEYLCTMATMVQNPVEHCSPIKTNMKCAWRQRHLVESAIISPD